MNKEERKWCDDTYLKSPIPDITVLEVIISLLIAISFIWLIS